MAAEHPDHDFNELPAKAAARGFLPIIWQRKALVLLGLVLGLGGGFLFYLQREPVYEAKSLVIVIKRHPAPIMPKQGVEAHTTYYEDYMASHVIVLKSPRIIARAIQKKDLTTLKTFEGSTDHISLILNGLVVSRDIKEGANNIAFLTFRGPVPEDCGKILAAIIDSYQEFLDQSYRSVSDLTHEQIVKARDILVKDMKEIDERRVKFAENAPGAWNEQAVKVLTERLGETERRITLTALRKKELDVRVKSLKKSVDEGKGAQAMADLLHFDDAKNAVTPERLAAKSLNEQLLPLLKLETELLEKYEKDHPHVQAVRNLIELVKDNHKKLDGINASPNEKAKEPYERYLAGLQAAQGEMDLFLKSLEIEVDVLNKQARVLRSYETQEESIRSEAISSKKLYEAAVNALREISFGRGETGFNVNVLAPAGTGIKVAPSAFQTIVGGSMLGLLLGIGLAFLADFTDKGFRSPDDIRVHLQLPLLGHVPYLKADPEVEKKVAAGEIEVDPHLCALFRSKSVESESYRAIRTALLFSVQGQGHRIVQVTSPNKGDGKSLTLANLAISISQAEKKVLIIDADCRRPRQHKIFNLPNTQGLVNVIRQDATWQACVQKSPAEGLWILTSGPIPQNPAELLTSPQFKQFLEEAREEFDVILVDSPPLLAVTDPCIISGKVDGVVLVLRLSRQGRPNAERAVQIMKSVKVNVVGLVVNGVSRQGTGIYSSEQYDYAESYTTENEGTNEHDSYYYDDQDAYTQPDTKATPAQSSSSPGLWGRLFSRKT
jgi:polysaccharide biosynthesis transport protein